MSVAAYKRTMRETQSPRETERQIISRITAGLALHAETYDAAETIAARLSILAGGLQGPLSENIRLWAALKADLSRDENALAPELRARLISLALFVERHTTQVLRGEAKIGSLVMVNRALIDGLTGIAPPAPTDV